MSVKGLHLLADAPQHVAPMMQLCLLHPQHQALRG